MDRSTLPRLSAARAVIVTLLALTPLAVAEPAAADDTGTITFVMTGLRNDKGSARCDLHDKPDAYPRKPAQAVASIRAVIQGGVATCVFPGVRAGTYAVSGFHDENDNGKFDIGLLGPTEGWAASNDARGLFGPKFADARFDFKGGALGLKAKTVY